MLTEGRFRGLLHPAARGAQVRCDLIGTPNAQAALHGELHNTAELATEFGMAPDTPIPVLLLAGWQRWQAALLPRLDGVFVLALFDGTGLHLYRDPSGLRDLFATPQADGTLAFASWLDGLFALPGTRRRIARSALHEYLRFLDIAAPACLFEGVVAVEPGQLLSWGGEALAASRPTAPPADVAPGDFEQAVHALDTLLHDAVSARLAGAARPAVFLSGGIDSALLCAIAAKQRPNLVAITVGFDGSMHDEAPAAAAIAAHLQVAQQVLRFGRAALLGAQHRLASLADQPLADPSTPSTLLAFEQVQARFDAVLDGTGADEAVGLMPPRHIRIAVGHASRLPAPLRVPLAGLLRRSRWTSGYAPLLDYEHPAETMIRWHGFSRHEVAELCGEPAASVSFENTRFYRDFAFHPRHAHFERYSALIDAMPCERLTQAMLASGVAVRFPFCAPQTDRFLREIRTDFRWLPGQPKRILRALLSRYVPSVLWERPKHGFDFPLAEYLAGDDHALVHKHLSGDGWPERAGLSPTVVQHWGRRFIDGDHRLAFKVWALVVLGSWLDAHKEIVEWTP